MIFTWSNKFFDNKCPLDNLYNEIYFIKYINELIITENRGNDIIIVAPDEGNENNYV